MDNRLNKKIISEQITESITRLSIVNIDFYENSEDRLFLKNVFKLFFKDGDRLFFSFRREENLTDDKELVQLRQTVPRQFRQNGEYIFLRKVDEERFDGVGYIKYNDNTLSFLLDVWKYFYAFTVFLPRERLTWSDYIHYVKMKGIDDIDGRRMLNDRLTNFVLIKGLGGDYLNISYLNDVKLPAITSLMV